MANQDLSTRMKKLVWALAVILISALSCNLPGFDRDTAEEAVLAIPGPMVAFQEPVAGLQVDLNQPFAIFVTARDDLGVIRLDLWVDGTLVLSQAAPESEANGVNPLGLSYGMIGTTPGTYSMVARAYNSLGAVGESLALHVTVSNEQAAPANPETVHYVAQSGDTVDSIASDTGSSASAISAANPGVKGPLNPGQVVVVPGAQANQPPAQPAQPPAGQQGGQIAGQAAVLPGLLPVQAAGIGQAGAVAQGIAPGQAGQVAQLAPNLFPGFQPIQNLSNPQLVAPDSLTVSTADCKVTLTWKDNSTGETGFTIYRRLTPDQVAPQYVTTVSANQSSYVDTVPHPGTYEYMVEAAGKIDFVPPNQIVADVIQQNMISTTRSTPVFVDVKPTSACIDDPERVKYIHFKPINLTPTRGAGFAALWYSINNTPGRRVPSDQGVYTATGAWNMPEEIVPVTASYFLNPDQNIMAKFWSAATTLGSWSDPRGPTDLGEAFNVHLPGDIDVKDDRYYVAKNDNFSLQYKIWVEDLKWTANGTTNTIAAPTNLRVKRTTTNSRVITWDWNGDFKLIDGFLVYKTYSCPGMDSQIYAPVIVPAPTLEYEIPFRSEPMGCLYRYEISAYGRVGESGRSNKLEGQTEAAYALAGIAFRTLKINDLPYGPGGVNLKIFANQHRRTSNAYWVKEDSYDLGNWILDGRRPHNAMGMALAEKEFLTVGFSVSGVDSQGYVAQDSVCKGASILPPVNAWNQAAWTVTIKSPDGACELTIELDSQKSAPSSSGAIVYPHADIAITKVERIGYRLFAYVENLGPDELPNNRIGYGVTWGFIQPDGELKVDGPWMGENLLAVQSNLPQWISMPDYVDQNYVYFCGKDYSKCERAFLFKIWEYGKHEDPKAHDFTDSNLKNNRLVIQGNQIEPMK